MGVKDSQKESPRKKSATGKQKHFKSPLNRDQRKKNESKNIAKRLEDNVKNLKNKYLSGNKSGNANNEEEERRKNHVYQVEQPRRNVPLAQKAEKDMKLQFGVCAKEDTIGTALSINLPSACPQKTANFSDVHYESSVTGNTTTTTGLISVNNVQRERTLQNTSVTGTTLTADVVPAVPLRSPKYGLKT
ncbi:hypothetical protein DICVIV_12682 [Dictyocaulus viviparus]|uniref:Uncharacterized protein n=1 Tax=Dictyocaulus viviparus TaxID=29172 RepID=A0A0D8XG44_DICVI|nr:hypothetical protein DICVIV_12682 [Dictyocaulus viviparus]